MEDQTEQVTEYTVKEDWDLELLYTSSQSAFETRDLKQALHLSEKGLRTARKQNNIKWIKDFDRLHSEVKSLHHELKAESYYKRAEKEVSVFKYERALKFLEKAKKHLSARFQLGKNQVRINKQIKKLDRKINEIAEQQKMRNSEILLKQQENKRDELYPESAPAIHATYPNDFYGSSSEPSTYAKESTKEESRAESEQETVIPPRVLVQVEKLVVPKGPPKRMASPSPKKVISPQSLNPPRSESFTIPKDGIQSKEEIKKDPFLKKVMKKKQDYEIVLDPYTSLSIDGSNIAWDGQKREKGVKAKLGVLLSLRDVLREKGFTKITIFCDYTLPWQIDEKEMLLRLIDNKEIIRTPSIKLEDGTYLEADKWILENAKNHDGYVIANDKYEDYTEDFGEEWIRERRIVCKNILGKFIFHPNLRTTTPDLELNLLEKDKISQDLDQANLEAVIQNFLQEDGFSPQDEHRLETLVNTPAPIPEKDSFNSKRAKERISESLKDQTLEKIQASFKERNYHILSPTQTRYITSHADMIAFKIFNVREFADVILCVPIKIAQYQGKFAFVDKRLEYTPLTTQFNRFEKEATVSPYQIGAREVFMALNDSVQHKSKLFNILKGFLKVNLNLEPIRSQAQSVLHCGLLEYKLFIHPILVCHNTTGSNQKTLEFPYDRPSNLYLIEIGQLSPLLEYLHKKYRYLEAHKSGRQRAKEYYDALEGFSKKMKYYSLPFLAYGGMMTLLFLFLEAGALQVFINISVGVLILFLVMTGYFYLQLNREKQEIIEHLLIPHYLRSYELTEADHLFLAEEFTLECIEQMTFECDSVNAGFPRLKEGIPSFRRKSSPVKSMNEDKQVFREPAFQSRPLGSDSEKFIEYSTYLEDPK